MNVRKAIRDASVRAMLPSGQQLAVINLAEASRIAAAAALTLGAVYRLALKDEVCPLCYIRNLGILSLKEQLLLADCHIAIVGAGGLGGMSAALFARLGIGKMTIIDGDSFEESNSNRQLFCLATTLGGKKAEVVVSETAKINPAVAVMPKAVIITDENAEALLVGAMLVLDALDNIPARCAVAAAAEKMGIPFIHGAVAGFVGQVVSLQKGRTLAAIYPDDVVLGVPSVLSFTPMLVASLQTAAALQVLLGKETVFAEALLHINLRAGELKRLRW